MKLYRLKSQYIIACCLILVTGCQSTEVFNNKDLNQNMLDIRIYQENLGEHLRQNRLKEMENTAGLLKYAMERYSSRKK